jgi:hypothetical protein
MINVNISKSTGKISKGLLILGGIIVVIILIAITGGGEKKPTTAPEKVSPVLEKTFQGKPVYSIDQEVILKEIRWKIIDVNDRGNVFDINESKYFEPIPTAPELAKPLTTEGKFIEVVIEVENVGKEERPIPKPIKLVDDKERKFESHIIPTSWVEKLEKQCDISLKPGFGACQYVEIYEVAPDSVRLLLGISGGWFSMEPEAFIELGL